MEPPSRCLYIAGHHARAGQVKVEGVHSCAQGTEGQPDAGAGGGRGEAARRARGPQGNRARPAHGGRRRAAQALLPGCASKPPLQQHHTRVPPCLRHARASSPMRMFRPSVRRRYSPLSNAILLCMCDSSAHCTRMCRHKRRTATRMPTCSNTLLGDPAPVQTVQAWCCQMVTLSAGVGEPPGA